MIPPSALGEIKEEKEENDKDREQQAKEEKEHKEKEKAKEQKAKATRDSAADNATRRRKSFSDVPEPEDLEGEVETKRPARPGSRIGSAIKRGTSMSLRRTPSPSSLQAEAYHSFVIEVRRKEFTTNIVTHVFALEDKSEVEAWVTALHKVIIAFRCEQRVRRCCDCRVSDHASFDLIFFVAHTRARPHARTHMYRKHSWRSVHRRWPRATTATTKARKREAVVAAAAVAEAAEAETCPRASRGPRLPPVWRNCRSSRTMRTC
jgi:hypothetical protein